MTLTFQVCNYGKMEFWKKKIMACPKTIFEIFPSYSPHNTKLHLKFLPIVVKPPTQPQKFAITSTTYQWTHHNPPLSSMSIFNDSINEKTKLTLLFRLFGKKSYIKTKSRPCLCCNCSLWASMVCFVSCEFNKHSCPHLYWVVSAVQSQD